MININNYKEKIETPNGDGTKRVELFGCKIMDNGEEKEVDITLHRVSEDEQFMFPDNLTEESPIFFALDIPE